MAVDHKESAKERILREACDLFYREGVRAVGIDRIIEESGVAKASFYRNFATKDDLVVAYLEHREAFHLRSLEEVQLRYPDSPKMQIYTLVENLIERMGQPEFRGCPFMNTVVEFPDPSHPGHQKAVEVHRQLWNRIGEIARQGGASNPDELAAQLRYLCNGALMVSYVDKAAFRPDYIRSAARQMIESQMA